MQTRRAAIAAPAFCEIPLIGSSNFLLNQHQACLNQQIDKTATRLRFPPLSSKADIGDHFPNIQAL